METPTDPSGLVFYGEPVKVLKTTTKADGTEVAHLGGHLVVFSGPESPDLEGDYFTKATDFGTLSRKGRAEVPAYYQHGFDPYFKNAAIGDAELSVDEFGVWAEYQVELRTDYERHLIEMARAGKMGQSSGAVAHLVERTKTVKDDHTAYHFKNWPIGEASLTPTPAEPRTAALPLKTFAESVERAPAVKIDTTDLDAAIDRLTAAADTLTQHETAMSDTTKTAESAVETPTPEQKDGSAIITPDQINAAVAKAFADQAENQKKSAPASLNTGTGAPAIIRSPGDSEAKVYKAWLSGDTGAVKTSLGDSIRIVGDNLIEIKASNDTDMNIGTAADGGNAVPTGHYQGIIARRDESRLNLGVMDIPGVGTTVNVPLDAEADGEFVSTAEAVANDRDAPALGQAAMTLVKYTKRIEFSNELMQDEDSRLMPFIENFVGRGMAKTHNSLLVTEVAANGANLNTTASATVLAAGELETAIFDDDLAHYLDGGGDWVMRPSTYSKIISITGNERLYGPTSQGTGASLAPTVLGYPVSWSNKVAAYGTTANKFALFGNFAFVGRREEPAFQVLRDPYSAATTGQVRLHYYFRTVYKVLQSEAVGYIDHA